MQGPLLLLLPSGVPGPLLLPLPNLYPENPLPRQRVNGGCGGGDACRLFLSPTLQAAALQNKTCVCFCGRTVRLVLSEVRKKKKTQPL